MTCQSATCRIAPCRIALLDDNTANRIAAGEVVERPASAVKELVENAIDAGAKRIVVRLEEGGKRLIEVTDDGCGMSAEEAVLAIQRHATSKIRSADDLFSIRTLGFRGEALPSIASVSRFTLTTQGHAQVQGQGPEREAEAGTRVLVEGGEILSVSSFGAPPGTSVVVRDLFFNTPARLKFLKSTASELARSIDLVGQLAAAHPHVAITLYESGVKRLATPGTGDGLEALACVWGREIGRRLKPIGGTSPTTDDIRQSTDDGRQSTDEVDSSAIGRSTVGGSILVSGYLCTPDLSRPGRSHELFFVNGRPIRSRLLSHALEDAVRAMTPDSRYPIAAVFISVPPDMVDVNVHPTKTEVKFTHDGALHHSVSQAIKRTLLDHGILPSLGLLGPTATEWGTNGAANWESRDSPSSGSAAPTVLSVADSQLLLGASAANTVREAALPYQPYLQAPYSHGPNSPGRNHNIGAAYDLLARASAEIFGRNGERASDRGAVGSGLVDRGSGLGAQGSGRPGQELRQGDEETLAAVTDLSAPLHSTRPFADQLRSFRVLGQMANTYIVAATANGLAIIDQHVAHERVLYERLTEHRLKTEGGRLKFEDTAQAQDPHSKIENRKSAGLAVQRLAVPFTLSLGPAEAGMIAHRREDFAEAGWDLEPFGRDAFLVRSVPCWAKRGSHEALLRDIVDELAHLSVSRRLLVSRDHVTITNACKMAVKAGDPLTHAEMEGLLHQLAETENPYLCPHGRPIVVTVGLHDIDRKFKR